MTSVSGLVESQAVRSGEFWKSLVMNQIRLKDGKYLTLV